MKKRFNEQKGQNDLAPNRKQSSCPIVRMGPANRNRKTRPMSRENAIETSGLPTVPLVVQTSSDLPFLSTRHDVPNPAMIAVQRRTI